MQRTTLLIVVVALCLQDALVHSVTLEASNLNDRTTWGGNDVQLTCREGNTGSELFNAVFTRDGVVISTDKDVNCLPSDVTYCAKEQGSLLHFTASNLTEGIFACKNSMDVESNEIAIIAYPAEVFTQTELTGMWGMDLVLPCRYQPGPLTNSPDNYYQHTWTAILDGQLTSVSSNDNFQNNDNDFTLTIVKLNPILAMYDYRCGIDFLVKNELSQPYNLRDSTDAAPIHIMINESDGQASIVRSPSDVIVSAGEQATFTCTLSVTGNEKLQFQVFDTSLNDTLSGCEIDRSTNSRTDCSWPNDGINMTCDYSVPYEITCNLTLSGLTESSSTQVICSSGTGEGAPSATAGLAVRAIPTICASKMTTTSIMMTTCSNVCLPADEVGFSSATLASSIVVSIILSSLTSSLASMLVMYYLCIKHTYCRPQKEIKKHVEEHPTQKAAVYEEVDITDQSHRRVTNLTDTTPNIAYGKI